MSSLTFSRSARSLSIVAFVALTTFSSRTLEERALFRAPSCALTCLPRSCSLRTSSASAGSRATLRALAALQGRRADPETDEEPGKILHEYRPEATAWHTEHHWPVRDGELRYYGSADSTPWFLVLLATLGDEALTAELEPAWRAAVSAAAHELWLRRGSPPVAGR